MHENNAVVPINLSECRIAVLGLGHVGLPTALGLAELGWDIIGVDSDSEKIELIKGGQCPFYEPGLKELLTKHSNNPKFTLTDHVEEAIRAAAILFVCVGTPQAANGQADLTEVEGLARLIGRNLVSYKLIVEKSTVPAITGQWILKTILRHSKGHPDKIRGNGETGLSLPVFEVASNPEFLQEGKALEDFFHADRIICGVMSDTARAILAELYSRLDCPILFTDLTTAEVIKYAANAFLATKISFINMVADVCEAVGADVTKVACGLGLDSRIGARFLNAGIGFGGYCLPKDLRAFIHLAQENSLDCSLLRETENINENRRERLIKKLRQELWLLRSKTIAVLGLAFKAGTDDVREAPSLKIIEQLLREGARVQLYDPKAMDNARRVLPHSDGRVSYCDSAYEAAVGADALLILTEWQEFRELDFDRLRQLVRIPIVVDGRNLLEPEQVRRSGFEYLCIGRGSHGASALVDIDRLSRAAVI